MYERDNMSTVTLTKWGNSIGIRIPANIIKEARLHHGESLTISVNEQGQLMLSPMGHDQKDWTEKFNAIADAQHDESMLMINNEFDDEDWTW
jgi:antitoxin component of MazEF toxin-antitoxin module